MARPSAPSYAERLETFDGHWGDCQTTARQLAAIGHIADRPPLEVLEQGSHCISCNKFVRKDLSLKALGDQSSPNYEDDFRGFAFHNLNCLRLQVRIPLEPQALLGGLYGNGLASLESLRNKFERRRDLPASTGPRQRLPQISSLFSLPTEIRLEIYAIVLPRLEPTTEICTLNRDSPRVITRTGLEKTGPRDTTKPNILRTCRAVHEEAADLIYAHTTFQFASSKTLASSKTMYLFLRNIGKCGRQLVQSVDIHCGTREDAMAFALLASCEKLRSITIRLGRPKILRPEWPLWCHDGMSCLLVLSGLRQVNFGYCESNVGYMEDGKPDAEIIRRELMRPKGTPGSIRTINGYLDV